MKKCLISCAVVGLLVFAIVPPRVATVQEKGYKLESLEIAKDSRKVINSKYDCFSDNELILVAQLANYFDYPMTHESVICDCIKSKKENPNEDLIVTLAKNNNYKRALLDSKLYKKDVNYTILKSLFN